MSSILRGKVVKSYVSYPTDKSTKNAILFLPDAFGLEFVNNKLLADDFARAGYFTVIPDIFEGTPIPVEHLLSPGSHGDFDIMAWVGTHPSDRVDPIIEKTIKGMKSLGTENIGAVGYCFGGRYVIRFLAEGKGVDAGFIAHPSFVYSEELEASKKPLSIAAAGKLLFLLIQFSSSYSSSSIFFMYKGPREQPLTNITQKRIKSSLRPSVTNQRKFYKSSEIPTKLSFTAQPSTVSLSALISKTQRRSLLRNLLISKLCAGLTSGSRNRRNLG
jgi:hypothetical protein